MKKPIWIAAMLAAICILTSSVFAKDANGYEIKVHIEGLRDTGLYLGNHYGDKQYVRDTIRLDQNGWGTFKGPDTLPGGIYLVILPNKTYFEILANEQKFTIETDTIDYVQHMKVSGSLENKLFNDHQKYIIEKSKETQLIKVRLDANKDNKDSVAVLREKLNSADKEVKAYLLKIVTDYLKMRMALLLIQPFNSDILKLTFLITSILVTNVYFARQFFKARSKHTLNNLLFPYPIH